MKAILVAGRARSLSASLAAMSAQAPPAPVVALVRRLSAAGIEVALVEDLHEARAIVETRRGRRRAGMDDSGLGPPGKGVEPALPLLLDLEAHDSDDPEDLEAVAARIAACRAVLPEHRPIAITANAPPRLLLACVRAGALDVIDLGHEGTATARATLLRAMARDEHAERQLAAEMRELLDELVRDLVRTERRTIDLERQLRAEPGTSDDRSYLEHIKARHEQLLARYLALKDNR